MQASDFVIATSLIVGLSGPALAQDPVQTVRQASTNQPIVETDTSRPVGWMASAQPIVDTDTSRPAGWMLSALLGTNLGGSRDLGDADPSLNYGFSLAYAWGGIVGAEVLADFAPGFDMDNAFLADSPSVNTYMLNAIAAIPFGDEGSYRPYVSGGWGGIHLKTDVFQDFELFQGDVFGSDVIDGRLIDLDDLPVFDVDNTIQGSHLALGVNFGVGMVGYGGPVGFRADLRYYGAGDNSELTGDTLADNFAEALVSGLNFWRLNAGIAFRW